MKREVIRWALLFIACITLYTVCVSTGINHSLIHAEERKLVEERINYSGCLEPFSPEDEAAIIEYISRAHWFTADTGKALYPHIGREFNYVEFGTGSGTILVLYNDNFDHFGVVTLGKTDYPYIRVIGINAMWDVDVESLREEEPTHKGKITIPGPTERTPATILYPDIVERVISNYFIDFEQPWDEGEYAVTVGWYEDLVDIDESISADFEIYFEMANRKAYHSMVLGSPESIEEYYYGYQIITPIHYLSVNPTQPKPREAWVRNRVLRERVKEAAVWEGTFVVGEDGGKYVEGGLK